ncbi:MAG: NADH-quinone oxidoreductase subunit J [Byssovorax sp.]
MNVVETIFFAVAALLVFAGGVVTVAARNPIRSAMGLLTSIVGIAGLYLMLSAEFLAAIQILVYAGAVVVLFLFVIMLLGPASLSGRDTRTAIPRYLGMIVFSASAASALYFLYRYSAGKLTAMPKPPAGFGTVEAIGHQLFTTDLVPFEITGALLLIAAVGAIAVARGKQPDPTLHPAAPAPGESPEGAPALAAKESAK